MKKLAYLILAHADPAQLQRLISAINHQAQFFVHIDAKSDIAPFKALELPPNVTFVQSRVSVSWAGISMIDATLSLIRAALGSGEAFSHLVLLSGADHPIKPVVQIHEAITHDGEHEFIRYIDMRESPEHYMRQITQKWFKEPWWRSRNKWLALADKGFRFLSNKMRLPNPWNPAVVPYFGSQWWALTPACCRYILDYIDAHPEFHAMNRHSFSPDEHYIHTLVGNSPFAKNSDGLQPFQGRGTWRMANLHIIHPSLSKWYTLEDWDEVSHSEKLFVRKVNSTQSNGLITKINHELLA